MKKNIRNLLIASTAKYLAIIFYSYNAIKLIFTRINLKLKHRKLPKKYSEFKYAFVKTWAIFESQNIFVQRMRFERLLNLLIDKKLSGFRLWKALDKNTFHWLFQKYETYDQWCEANFLSQDIIKSLSQISEPLELKEDFVISLITPVYKTNQRFLKECIDSVINQIYKKWELIIVDDGSDSRDIEDILNRYKDIDSRIKIIFLKKNQGIVSATNIGIGQATGAYIGFLDHDDLLSRDALFLIANAIHQNPRLDYIYTDEDKINEWGGRYDPNFKGEFNGLMAKFHNYTHHLSVYSDRILADIGELDQGILGAQDFDLLLRAQEFLREENVCHIPYICYHWRSHAESTASAGGQKKYVLNAAKKAITKSLKREKINCELFLPEIAKKHGWTLWQPHWRVGDISELVTIVIPTKNKGELIFNCIESIKSTCHKIPKIIIIDDNSTELRTFEIFHLLKSDTKLNIEIIKSPYSDKEFNYARLINFGAGKISTKYFLQLNNDIEALSANWIEQMVGWMQFQQVGVVGAKLKYPNGRLQHAGVVVGPNGGLADHQFHDLPDDRPGYVSLPHVSREVSAVTGACLLTDTNLFHDVGGFDEIKFAVEFNDVDYCLRVTKFGKKIVYAAGVELMHITSASRGNAYNPQEHINFLEKYRGYIDPYFSPNVNIDSMSMTVFCNELIYKYIAPKPRLIIISHALSRTGAPITALEFALEMKKRGYEIDFVTFEDGPLKKQLLDSGINVHNLDLSRQIYNVDSKEVLDKLSKIFLRIDLNFERDIVICNTILTFLAINNAHTLNIKTIWHIHENTDYQSFVSLLGDSDLRQMAFQSLSLVDNVIFQSEATKMLYINYFSPEKVIKISGGMPIERIRAYLEANEQSLVRRKLDIAEGRHVISLIGTTCDRKGQKEFLEAVQQIDWKAISEYVGEITVLIVGRVESDYSRALELQASKIKDLDIRIIDEVSNIYDFYFITDTFVCASKEESFPMVVLLAMAFNTPIVSTLVGGIGEMLQDGHDATLALKYTSECIKEALIKSLTNSDRAVMAKRAYTKILRFFDNKKLYDKHEDVIFSTYLKVIRYK